MAVIGHPDSRVIIEETKEFPFSAADEGVQDPQVEAALEDMILSPSGWRGIFALDGDGEGKGEGIPAAHKIILAAGAKVFADYIKTRSLIPQRPKPVVIVGMDTRPSGRAIADILIRVLITEGCTVRFALVTAAPEIMAYARACGIQGTASGFVYISASHNPIGHNGLKFGLTDGGVLAAEEANRLIEAFRSFMADPSRIPRAKALVLGADVETLAQVYGAASQIKTEAYDAYLSFTKEVVGGSVSTLVQPGSVRVLDAVAQGLQGAPLSIAADLNGSARTLSIDRGFFTSLGLGYYSLNDTPGRIAHRIVPEGESLEPCRQFLEELHTQDPSVLVGYVPDCDGDRGNLVIWDERGQCARCLDAQEVFALACVAELAHLVWTGELSYDAQGRAVQKAAVVVNDPTSLRVDRIAAAFDVALFRVEVGEAHVVGRARKLREEGYTVRILGEGAAGGNITHPSAVRDPINTVMALIKLLTIRSSGDKPGFFKLWWDRSAQADRWREDFSLSDIIASLPPFVSTGSYTPEALLQVKTRDHGALKDRYQGLFLREWESRKADLKSRYGIIRWEAACYQGMEERRGITRFGDARRGGLKITFTNQAAQEIAALWMRGSGTEPVFRVMADAAGDDPAMERDLIQWQRRMVMEADEAAD
ncbi:MAG: phosphatidylglycerol lysyltransferase [Spirochaetaceae bacterium]|jgi:phosphoglucomutase|nr:phosphatidylglycerol lysyltransferase [Spirochaetaceae bacterium]